MSVTVENNDSDEHNQYREIESYGFGFTYNADNEDDSTETNDN